MEVIIGSVTVIGIASVILLVVYLFENLKPHVTAAEGERYYDDGWREEEEKETPERLSLLRRANLRIWSILYPEEECPFKDALDEDVRDHFDGLMLSLAGRDAAKVRAAVERSTDEVDKFIFGQM